MGQGYMVTVNVYVPGAETPEEAATAAMDMLRSPDLDAQSVECREVDANGLYAPGVEPIRVDVEIVHDDDGETDAEPAPRGRPELRIVE